MFVSWLIEVGVAIAAKICVKEFLDLGVGQLTGKPTVLTPGYRYFAGNQELLLYLKLTQFIETMRARPIKRRNGYCADHYIHEQINLSLWTTPTTSALQPFSSEDSWLPSYLPVMGH